MSSPYDTIEIVHRLHRPIDIPLLGGHPYALRLTHLYRYRRREDGYPVDPELGGGCGSVVELEEADGQSVGHLSLHRMRRERAGPVVTHTVHFNVLQHRHAARVHMLITEALHPGSSLLRLLLDAALTWRPDGGR